jgi:hypothetical protein
MTTQLASTSQPFNIPTQISGCALWLDAYDTSTISLSGTNVTRWNDKSGNGRNATTYGTSPTFSNGAVRFATNQGLSNSLSASVNVESGFFICGFTNVAGVNTLLGSGNGEGGRQFRVNNTIQTVKQNVANVLITGSNLSSATTYLTEYVNTGSLLTHFINGSTYASGASLAYDAGRTTSIGLRNGLAEPLNGYIQEIVVYSSALSTAQRQQIEGYLAWKWSLTSSLPTGHPYKKTPYFPFPLALGTATLTNNSFFQPTQISGCALWLDGADKTTIVQSDGSISQWTDKSGLGYSFTQATTSNQPTYSTSGFGNRGSLVFNGSSSYLFSSTFGGLFGGEDTPLSFFTVMKFTNHTSPALQSIFNIYTGLTTNGWHGVYVDNNAAANKWRYTRRSASGTDVTVNSATNIVSGVSYIHSQIFPGTTVNGFINGTQDANFTNASFNAPTLGTNNTIAAIGILYRSGQQYPLNGEIGEVIVYQGAVTTAQRQQIEGYLAWKWGLEPALPVAQPYKTVPINYAPTFLAPSVFVPRFTAVGWQPSALSGLNLWLDAADTSTVSVSGNTVTAWRDKSSLAYTGSSSAGRNFTYASNILNRLNCIQTATGQTVSIPNFVLGPSMSVFLLYFPINQSTGSPFIEQGPNANSSAGFYLHAGGGQSFFINNGGVGTFINAGNVTVSNTWQLLEGINKDPNASNTMSFYTNGTVRASGGNTTTSSITTATLFINGRNNTNTVSIASYIAEIIIYNVEVSNSQRQQVEGYLAWKWGTQTSLPGTHPYRKFPPPPQ